MRDVNEILLVAVLACGAYAVRLLARRGGDARKAELELWQRAATLVGGEMVGGSERFSEPAMEIAVDDVPLVLRTRSAVVARTETRSTIAHAAPLPGAASLRVHVSPRSATSRLVRPIVDRLAGASVTTGDDAFDAAFDVRSEPRALAIELLDRSLRNLLRDAGQGFVVEEGELSTEREGAPEELEPLVELARFAERLVAAWIDTVQGPVRVARTLEWVPETARMEADGEGYVVARGVRRGVPCELVVRFRDDWALTVVRLLGVEGASDASWSVVRDAASSGGFTETGAVPEPYLLVARGGPSVLVGVRRDGSVVELAFDGLRPEAAQIATVLEAALAAATPDTPYR